MEPGIYGYILKYSKPQQIVLTLLAAISFPFYFFSLDLPKTIINRALKTEGDDWPQSYYGLELDQIPFLLVLCTLFLILVFINGGFKYFINVYRGSVGERMLRRLRHELLGRIMRFPLPQFRKTSQGEIVSMVTLETEPLGGFFGDSFSLPIYQGGQLITLLVFMFVQNPILGFAAIALYPFQMYIIPKLQSRVNALGKDRVMNVRRLSERIGEVVGGAPEIHANDTSQYEQADFSHRLGKIYDIRYEIYQRKFFIKFLNNFLAQLTPFFFYSIGGILVINGGLTIGALVAILAAYKDVSGPWKMLLTYYQRKEDARIKYDQLIEKFQPSGMIEVEFQTEQPDEISSLTGQLVASNVSWEEEDGLKVVNGATISLDLPKHVAIVGPGGGGKNEFSQLLARLLSPSSGQITIGGKNISELPETVTGRRIAYVGQEPYLFSGSIQDNLFYGLKHRPVIEPAYDDDAKRQREQNVGEAEASGNSTYDIAADWIDGQSAGAADQDALIGMAIELLETVGLVGDVFDIGLRRSIDPSAQAELAGQILNARKALRQRLEDPTLATFVETFDSKTFNSNASVAENILFGTPVGDEFAIENLGENAYVLEVLEKVGIAGEFLDKGRRLAEVMVELFKGLPPDHEFFERFSFIGSDDLPEFEAMLRRVDQHGLDGLSEEDKGRMLALPFKLITARHHIDIIDDAFKERLLEARREFAANLPENLKAAVEFFDVDAYNASSSVQDNILFGKRDSSRAESGDRVGGLISEIVDETGIRRAVIELGLQFDVGIAGVRLSAAQRQRLAIARALIKRPDLLILNESLSNLDAQSQAGVVAGIRRAQENRSIILVDGGTELSSGFDQVLTMESGRITSTGADDAPPPPAPEAAAGEEGGAFGAEIDALAAIPFFAGLDRSKLKLMAFASERFKYKESEIVFRQGDVGDKAYIIIDGTVEVVLDTQGGEKTVAVFGHGDLFGELALLCDAPRSATIRAISDLSVLSISKDVFLKLISEDVATGMMLTRSVAERLERTTRDLSDAATIRDSITQLPDSRAFAERFQYMAARNERYKEKSTIMRMDAKKLVNLGAIKSEEDRAAILLQIGEKIQSCLRSTDMVSRLKGSKFFILLNPITEDNLSETVAGRIAKTLSDPVMIGGTKIKLGPEAEFSICPLTDGDLDRHILVCERGEGTVVNLTIQ